MTILEVCALSAGYARPVVRDVSVSISSGELVCLLGRNGSGKTTLFRAILGSARIFAGDVRVGGAEFHRLTVRQRARLAAVVSQEPGLSPGLRVSDVLEMGAYAEGNWFGTPSVQARERIAQYAERFGVRTFLESDMATLSAGQRQLVHLTRAAVQNTPLLLLDEPNSALDFFHTRKLLSELRALASDGGRGVLAVLHDPALALNHADRILTMEDGRLIDELFPAKEEAACMEHALTRLYPGIRVFRDVAQGRWFCDIYE